MQENNVNIDDFLIAINNLLSSKYILVDRKISDILLSIAGNASVYNLIAECMVNFDFREEWENATKGESIELPNTNAKQISFIFCLLNNIDDGNLDITRLLEKFFSNSSNISPYDLFCKNIIVKFKNLVMEELGIELFYNNENQKPDEVDDFETLSGMLRDFSAMINSDKHLKKCFMPKPDIIAVVSTFEQAVLEHKTEYFYGFLVTLKANFQKNKLYKSKLDKILTLTNDIILRGWYGL